MGKTKSQSIDYNRLADSYARYRKTHAGVFKALLAACRSEAASRVLEIGCGTGNYIGALQAETGCLAVGMDPSAQMVKNAALKGGKIRYILGRGEAVPLRKEYFDLLFSVDVIHHISDRAAYFQEAIRVLTPGGRICTVTDSEAIIRGREPLARFFPETIEVELRRYPSVSWLQDALQRTGFEAIGDEVVETVSQVTDIRPFREKAFSSLHLIPAAAYERGIQEMEEVLRSGPIRAVSRYILIWGRKPAWFRRI